MRPIAAPSSPSLVSPRRAEMTGIRPSSCVWNGAFNYNLQGLQPLWFKT